MLKRLIRSVIGKYILAWLFHKYCLFAYYSSKRTFLGKDIFDKQFETGKPLIFAIWHGRMVFMSFMDKDPLKTFVLISRHGDGALIAKVMDFFHVRQVRGSSNRSVSDKKGAKDRGGGTALRESMNLLLAGNNMAITPDGPKGPRMRVRGNIINIAKLTGAIIIPISFSSSRCHIFKSWDRFMLPLPFGRAFFVFGKPISINKESDKEFLEKAGKELENQLNEITQKADELAGIEPIKPA